MISWNWGGTDFDGIMDGCELEDSDCGIDEFDVGESDGVERLGIC